MPIKYNSHIKTPADFSLYSTTRANQPAHWSCWLLSIVIHWQYQQDIRKAIITFANVPADLCSAGIEYQDFQSDYFLFDFTLYL